MNDEIDTTVPDDPAGNQLADNKSHAVANLKVVAGELDDEFHGMVFKDSDVYKWLEEAAYALAYHPDPELKALCDRTVNLIARAQQPDGYLDTPYQVKSGVWVDRPRFSLIQQSHEMYVMGRYIEAAVAYHQVTGNEQALEVAKKMADCLDANFGPEEGKIHGADGHAVRVGYLCTGVAHVGRLLGDQGLIDTAKRLWKNIVTRRMYVTGAIGSTHVGELFTYDYDLPNDTMYGETCASVDRYIYTERDGGKTVLSHQFIANKAEFASGLTVEQRSDFPWNGHVEYTVSLPASATDSSVRFGLRIPGWSLGSYALTVNGKSAVAQPEDGFVYLMVNAGDTLELDMSSSCVPTPECVPTPARWPSCAACWSTASSRPTTPVICGTTVWPMALMPLPLRPSSSLICWTVWIPSRCRLCVSRLIAMTSRYMCPPTLRQPLKQSY